MEETIMMYNGIEFNTYFKNYPDANGYFGKYGGLISLPSCRRRWTRSTLPA